MKKCRNWQRYALKWDVLAALILILTGIIKTSGHTNPDAFCPFGGLQAFAPFKYADKGIVRPL